jgi:UDP-N-acetylmuramate--alanine ligase
VTYSLRAAQARLLASPPVRSPTGIAFRVKARDTGEAVEVALKVPGLHNVANALAALCAAEACGVGLTGAAGPIWVRSAASAGGWRLWARQMK